jgi:hypothetical protein
VDQAGTRGKKKGFARCRKAFLTFGNSLGDLLFLFFHVPSCSSASVVFFAFFLTTDKEEQAGKKQ